MTNNRLYKGSSGLSGEDIAGIVIASVFVVAVVGILIILWKKGIFSGANALNKEGDAHRSIAAVNVTTD